MIRIPILNQDGVLVYDVSVQNAKKYISKKYKKETNPRQSTARLTFNQFVMLYNNDSAFVDEGDMRQKEYYRDSMRMSVTMKTPIDLLSPILQADDSPFSATDTAVFAKLQFMFLMLNLSQLYITRKGKLVGLITRDLFIGNLDFSGHEDMISLQSAKSFMD